mmetsp:Transcript_9286/g.15317  ORF Transcript_9286/g.15317 Transcript_9286/m.15317 type:complete len:121 (-) Transcript_9286:100-462(-)
MLAAKRLPEILRDSLEDGIDGLCLMTQEGSLLSSALNDKATVDEIGLAAISSSIWGNYLEGTPDISMHIVKLETGYLGISAAGNGYLIAGVGSSQLSIGLLKVRLEALSKYFAQVFEQIK